MPRRLIGQTDRTGRLKKKPKGRLGFGGAFSSGDSTGLSPERQALVDAWAADPWAFLIATDPTTEGNPPVILTLDERDELTPYKSFPTDRPYLRTILAELFGPHKRVFVDKPRQVMATWIACLALLWYVLFKEGRNCFISKSTREEAEVLLKEKIRDPLGRTPNWFQAWAKCTSEPLHVFSCLRTESKVSAVSQNAATAAFRGPTPSVVLIDEAAFQQEFAAMLQAAHASAARLWVLTTPNVGNPGAAECKAILTDGDAAQILAAERAEEPEDEPAHPVSWDQR